MRRLWHRQEMLRLLSLMAVTLWGVVAVDSTLPWAIAQGDNALGDFSKRISLFRKLVLG